MALSIRLVPSFFQNQLGTLLHLILQGFFPRPLHLFHPILLPFQHLLRLNQLAIPILREKRGDGALTINRLLRVEETSRCRTISCSCDGVGGGGLAPG